MLHQGVDAVQNDWVAINYTLPREPSRARVSVWRKLKKAGAVNILQSMWILPANEENMRALEEIKGDVAQDGGEAFLIAFTADEDGRRIMVEKLNAARDEEYREFLEQCEEFFKEIEKEVARENFSFAEVEENEEELEKLKQWHEKIAVRDAFGASLQGRSREALARCEAALEGFCDRVYEYNEGGQAR
jgi:vacuolar-type H+-ATPase subunit I/STV1